MAQALAVRVNRYAVVSRLDCWRGEKKSGLRNPEAQTYT